MMIAAGVAIRLLLAPFTSWERDVSVWFSVSTAGAHHLGLYARPDFSYPAGWGVILQAIGVVLPHLGLPASSFATRTNVLSPLASLNHFSPYVTSPWFNIAFKSVLGAFDLATALVTLALVQHITGSARRARLAFGLVFLNPLSIFLSAVLGQFDSIVAFAFILGVYATLRRRPALAGAAIGLGIVVKVVPVVVVPVLLAVFMIEARGSTSREVGDDGEPLTAEPTKNRWALRASWPSIWRFIAAGAAVGAFCVLPEVLSHGLADMVKGTTAREGQAPGSGGLGVYGLTVFKHFDWLRSFLAHQAGLAHDLSDLAAGAVALIGILRLARRGPDPLAVVAVVAAEIAALLLTVPESHPQYFVWLLPLVVVLVTCAKVGRFALVVVSLAPIVIFMFVFGPDGVIAPLAAFTHLASLGDVASHVERWIASRRSGIWTPHAIELPATVTIPLALVAEVLLIWRGVSSSWTAKAKVVAEVPSPLRPSASAPMHDWDHRTRYVSAALIECVVAASLLVSLVVAGGQPSGSVSLSSSSLRGRQLSLGIGLVTGVQQRSLSLTAFAINSGGAAVLHNLYVFYDPSYPEVGSTPEVAGTIEPHFASEMRLRRADVRVTTVDANQLKSVFSDTAHATGSAVVDITGVLPSSSYSKTTNLVRPWLAKGGLLIWAGSLPGAWSARPARSRGSHGTLAGIGQNCLVQCVRVVSPTHCTERGLHDRCLSQCLELVSNATKACPPSSATPLGLFAGDDTPVSAALQLSYRTILPPASMYGVLLGGTDIGWSAGRAASVSTTQIGRGHLVVFGGNALESQGLTIDIVSILLSRAYDIAGRTSAEVLSGSDLAKKGGQLTWTTELAGATNPTEVEVFATDHDLFGTVTGSWIVNQSDTSVKQGP